MMPSAAYLKIGLAVLLAAATILVGIVYTRPPDRPLPPIRTTALIGDIPLPRTELVVTKDDTPAPEPPAPEEPPTVTRADLPEPSAPPLEDMIERAMRAVVMVTTQTTRGSGFFIRPDLVATNAHVVAGYMFVAVTTATGAKVAGRIAQMSDQQDLALIQVPRSGPTDSELPLGESETLRLGQGVVALGWAQSLTQSTVTRGIVTGLRTDGQRRLIQTDGAPNPGDSGGPLLNRTGEVVGITTMRYDGTHGSGGLAIMIDDVKPFAAKVTSTVLTVPIAGGGRVVTTQAQPTPQDLRRASGVEEYRSVLSGIAQRAASLDAAWSRYKAACQITSVPPGPSREWFHLLDPNDPLHRTPEWCASALKDIERQAAAVDSAMTAAEERARQADVYPGSRRELRRQFRLDYPSWDR